MTTTTPQRASSVLLGLRNPMYLHIVVEAVCAILIVAYVRRSTRRLEAQIRDLNQIVQQQQEMIHMHHRILQAHGWTSETGRGPPSRTTVPSPLEDVSISDMTRMFKVPFTTEEVVILPHPTLARTPAGTPTVLVEEFPSQTIIDEKSESPSPSIDDEIADEIQELVKEEEKQAMTGPSNEEDIEPTAASRNDHDIATQEEDPQSIENEDDDTDTSPPSLVE